MPQLDELLQQISKLDRAEREQLVRALARDDVGMIDRPPAFHSIVATPEVCGGEARFVRTRIPVWTVERMRQLGMSDAEILRSFPTLNAADLAEARAYAASFPDQIAKAIRENEEV